MHSTGLWPQQPPTRFLVARCWLWLPLVLLLLGLMAYCLMDLARAPSVRYLPKPVWALIIVLVSFPLGAIAYLVLGKDHHDRQDSLPHDHDEPAARSWNPTG